MYSAEFASAIRAVGTQFVKLIVTEHIDSRGFVTEQEVSAGTFYASMQGYKDSTEDNTSAGTIYPGRSYLYVSELETTLSEGDRFSEVGGSGSGSVSKWVAKNLLDDYRDVAGYCKWLVERVII